MRTGPYPRYRSRLRSVGRRRKPSEACAMNRLSVIYKFWAILFILFVSACGSQGTQTTGKNGNTATVTIGLHRVLASVSGDAGDLAAVASITLTAGTTFTLRDGTNTVNGSVSYDAGTFSATFTPLSDISPNTTYTATITTGIQDLAGNGLAADEFWPFPTAALPPADTTPPSAVFPWDGQTGLSPNIVFPVFFSEPMNTATITTETFTLSDGTSLVDGFVSYGWYYPGIDVAAFVAPSFLLLNTTYTGTITTGEQDLAGNGLAAGYVFTFTTLGVPPTFAGIAIAVPSSPTSVDLAWSAATDDVSPSDQIVYDISLLTPPGDPVNTSYTSDPGATSFTISGLTGGADYCIPVPARGG